MFRRICSEVIQHIDSDFDENRRGGKNPFLQMLSNGQWENAKRIIQQTDKQIVRKWSVTPTLGGKMVKTDILPIHQACTKPDVPLYFIKLLIDAYPESIRMRDTASRHTVLHLALKSQATEDVIFYLLEKYPYSTKLQDCNGRVPLHYACSNGASLAVVKSILSTCPESICATDIYFWTPLHVASRCSISVDIVKAMLGHYPEAITMVNMKGNSAVSLAKMNESKAMDLIVACLIEEEQNLFKMPIFHNMRQIEKKSYKRYISRSESIVV